MHMYIPNLNLETVIKNDSILLEYRSCFKAQGEFIYTLQNDERNRPKTRKKVKWMISKAGHRRIEM